MTAFDARLFRLFDHRLKVSEDGVFQDACKVTGRPGFVAFRAHALDALEGVARGGNWWLIAHVIIARRQILGPTQRQSVLKGLAKMGNGNRVFAKTLRFSACLL